MVKYDLCKLTGTIYDPDDVSSYCTMDADDFEHEVIGSYDDEGEAYDAIYNEYPTKIEQQDDDSFFVTEYCIERNIYDDDDPDELIRCADAPALMSEMEITLYDLTEDEIVGTYEDMTAAMGAKDDIEEESDHEYEIRF